MRAQSGISSVRLVGIGSGVFVAEVDAPTLKFRNDRLRDVEQRIREQLQNASAVPPTVVEAEPEPTSVVPQASPEFPSVAAGVESAETSEDGQAELQEDVGLDDSFV